MACNATNDHDAVVQIIAAAANGEMDMMYCKVQHICWKSPKLVMGLNSVASFAHPFAKR